MKFLSQNYVKYGLLMTGVIAVCLFIMEVTGQNKSFEHSPIVFFFTAIAPAIIWFFGIRAKKKSLKGKLTFKQGLSEGFKISLVYGIASPFVFLFYYLFINPEIVEYVKEVYQMKNASDAMVIGVDLGSQFVGAVVFGTIYGAIISLFLKTKKK